MKVYVDGSGGARPAYGYFAENGKSFYRHQEGLTNNQAEYRAIIAALSDFDGGIVIYSDSKVAVSQLNHEFAINNPKLRDLARIAWEKMAKLEDVKIKWIPRSENPAGRMLGS